MQCVPCIYAIHTLYSHGTYIVFNMIPRHPHWKLYSLVKYMTCLVIHTSTQGIVVTFIDVGYTCDVNTVTHVEQSSYIQIVDMNRFFTGTCERLVNRLSEKVVKSRILPKIQVCSENKNKHKI